jgi:hypothetical protein
MESVLHKDITNTYVTSYEPLEKIVENKYRNIFTFDIKQNSIETIFLPQFCDIVLELSIVDQAEQKIKNKTVPGVTADPDNGIEAVAAIPKTSNTCHENNILYTFFKNIRVFLNNVLISDSFDLYHHKAYINILLSATNSLKKSYGETFGYFKEDFTKAHATKPSTLSKIDMSANSKKFIVRGRLFDDLFVQNNPIIASDLLFKFHRNEDTVMLHEGGKIQLHDFRLEMVCSNLSPQKAISLNTSLISNSYKYNTCEHELSSFELKNDFDHGVFKNLTSGSMPHYIVVCFIKTETLRGSYTSYPFYYEDPGIKDLYISNYDRKYPLNKGYTFHSSNKDYTSAYKALFDQTKIHSIDFNLSEFPNGYFLLTFDLTDDFSYGTEMFEKRTTFDTQNLQLYVSTHQPITGYSVILYMSRRKFISTNSLKQCIVSY